MELRRSILPDAPSSVAERMLTHEAEVLQIARNNLDRWLSSDSFSGSEGSPLLEWQEILEKSTSDEIRKILIEDTDEGQRLRSSSPFCGILSEEERVEIMHQCEKIIPA